MSDFVSLPETGPLAIEADAEELAPTDQILASCPWMLSVGGSCFTTASLADVQRVRISAGAHGRSRDEFHISGLWFEYRSRVHDTIVGQWMTELDQFTLGPQETLIEISVRATKDIDLRGTGGAVGKVVCLTFVTSLENRYEFRRSEASAESHVQYCATPYEDLVRTSAPFFLQNLPPGDSLNYLPAMK